MSQMFRSFEANSGTIQRKREMFKKAVQQGRRAFGARSVHGVREHAKSPRTQLAAFLKIPRKGLEDLATPSAPAADPSNLGQGPRAYPQRTGSIKIYKEKDLRKASQSLLLHHCHGTCPIELSIVMGECAGLYCRNEAWDG